MGKRDAQRLLDKELAKLVDEVEDGEHGATEGTFGYLLDEWMKHRQRDCSPTTLHEDRRKIEKDIRPALGHVRLDKLTAKDLDDFYGQLRDSGITRQSVPHYHRLIRAALQQAWRWEWVNQNVAARVKAPQGSKKARTSHTTPTVAEVCRLIGGAATSRNKDYADAFTLLAVSGVREGELCGLRFSDREGDELTVQRSVWQRGGQNGVKSTKSNLVRTVALEDALTIPIFEQQWDRRIEAAEMAEVEPNPDAYVFSLDPLGETYWLPVSVSHAFARVRKRLGIRTRLHDLRHWANSTAAQNGIGVEVRSAQLGHSLSGAGTNLAVYTHASLDGQREMVRGLAAALEALTP
jgi:integrase